MIELLQGNALHIPLADNTVQMVVTSPPYWNLRDYGTGSWMGGDVNCDHLAPPKGGRNKGISDKQVTNEGTQNYQYIGECKKCGAIRIDKQLGSESLHDCFGWVTSNYCGECYVCHTLQWTSEIWRVLREDGTFWLNLGDSYAGSGKGIGSDHGKAVVTDIEIGNKASIPTGLKAKDLIGIPWHVAFALQANGWYLRSDIIWSKTNPMPNPVKDRPTTSHEYIFLFAKNIKYYYDYMAIAEPALWTQNRLQHTLAFDFNPDHKFVSNKQTGQTSDGHSGAPSKTGRIRAHMPPIGGIKHAESEENRNYSGNEPEFTDREGVPVRNKRTVWTISTVPFLGAHFATFPPALVEPCIKAGSKEGNIVFDPFVGSGTTLQVARALGRNSVGMDLSFEYLNEQAKKRLGLDKIKKWYQSCS